MATQLLSKSFTDIFGNVTTFYQSNAGDQITGEFVVQNAIESISSDTNYYTVNNIDSTITRIAGEWEDEGFRVGQTIEVRNPGISTFTTTILFIYDNVMGVTAGSLSPLTATVETFGLTDFVKLTATVNHDSVDVLINFVPNGSGSSTASLIDGENTTLRFSGLNALAVSGSVSSVQVGNKSGQFFCEGELTLDSEVSNVRKYTFSLTTRQPGGLLQTSFTGSNCLKLIAQFRFQVVEGEPYGNSVVTYNEDADTGYLNEAYNTGVVNAWLIDSFTSLDYANASVRQFTIDSSALNRYIGAYYVPLDDTYNKNNDNSQSVHTMQLEAFVPYGDALYFSNNNAEGAGYQMAVSTVSTAGTQTTYQIALAPNTDLASFMDSRDEGDRRFVVYFKCGTVNLTLFDGQLTKEPQPAGELDVFNSPILDHANNVYDLTFAKNPIQYTESDLAMALHFRLPKEETYDRFVSIIEAYNTVNGDRFELEKIIFELSNVQISNDGVYLFNETIGRNNNLPSNSAKKIAKLDLYPSIDTLTKYGVKLYYPWVNRWEYWISQTNADVFFYPNQNKNWQQYSAAIDWNVRIRSFIQQGDLSWEHNKIITINDFDSGNFTTVIELFRENGDPCSAIVNGEVMTIKATHTAAAPINVVTAWGHIKIEQFENAPAWWCTSVLGNGNDANNPLSDFVISAAGNDLVFECKFDTNKLNTIGGVSISSEAFGSDEFDDYWLTTDGDFWLQSGTTDKWIIEE